MEYRNMIDISNRRECFFDDTLVDNLRTTSEFRLHHPVRKNKAFTLDAPWEQKLVNYFNFFEDDGIIRMYYVCTAKAGGENFVVCYVESNDSGKTWTRPVLNI